MIDKIWQKCRKKKEKIKNLKNLENKEFTQNLSKFKKTNPDGENPDLVLKTQEWYN